MRGLCVAVMAAVVAAAPVVAMDAEAEALVSGNKAGKLLPIEDVAVLMRASERWCYNEEAQTCDWSDIYLEVDAEGATYELADFWSPDVEIALTEYGVFRDGQFICETGEESTQTLRARNGVDGRPLGGRELFALKAEMAAAYAAEGDASPACFDYLFVGYSPSEETVRLTQRIWRDGTTDPAEDALVTLHFDPSVVDALSVRW
ncbi:hypothetical protein [Devosia nitrariae]|uniref:Uncharacterized protein n=1 Tax=Devosia nitrariae TaxID=2071872 RepID=A0ABQ5W030_9HYPH|nr:hypothetical protein [Devosia nitrariae]GLQ53383.1 hypothetical protein GCM10010862_06410 [Devosia nitrariae]